MCDKGLCFCCVFSLPNMSREKLKDACLCCLCITNVKLFWLDFVFTVLHYKNYYILKPIHYALREYRFCF